MLTMMMQDRIRNATLIGPWTQGRACKFLFVLLRHVNVSHLPPETSFLLPSLSTNLKHDKDQQTLSASILQNLAEPLLLKAKLNSLLSVRLA